MLQVVKEKQMRRTSDGKIFDFVRVMLVGKPNQSVESLKAEYAKYIPKQLLNKKSNLEPKNKELPVFSFWRQK